MPKKRSHAETSIAQIKRVRAPHKMQTPEDLVAHETKTNSVFASVAAGAPEDLEKKLEYLLAHIQTENELSAVGALAECFVQSNPAAALRVSAQILHEIEKRKDSGCVGVLFYMLKKLVAQHWNLLKAWVLAVITEKRLGVENAECFCTMLSEVLRVATVPDAEIESLFSVLSEEEKTTVLSELLLDRRGKIHFNVFQYRHVFRRVSPDQICCVVKRVAATTGQEEVDKVVDFLAESVDPAVLSDISSTFSLAHVLRHIEALDPQSLARAVERLGAETPEAAAAILRRAEPSALLCIAQRLAGIECKTKHIDAVLNKTVLEIEKHAGEVYAAHRLYALLVFFSIDPLRRKVILALHLNTPESMADILRAVEYATEATSEEDVVSRAGCAKFQSRTTPLSLDLFPSWVCLLSAYIKTRARVVLPDWIDHGVCEMIRFIGISNPSEGTASLRCSGEPSQLLDLVTKEIAGTRMMSLVMRGIAEEQGTLLEMHVPHTAPQGICALLHAHSLIRVSCPREHISMVDRVAGALKESTAKAYASRYFSAVFHILPHAAQKRVMRTEKLFSLVWPQISREYREYEAAVLGSVTGQETMIQVLPNGLAGYSTENIAVLDDACLLFVMFFMVDTKYPLHYLQVADKHREVFSAPHADGSASSGWTVQREPEGFSAFYHGVRQNIHVPLEGAAGAALQQVFAKKHTVARESSTESTDMADLSVEDFVFLVKQKALEHVEKHALRDVATRFLLGDFICPKKETIASMEALSLSHPLAKEVLLRYMRGQPEYRQFSLVLPELAASFPARHKKERSSPAGTLAPAPEESETALPSLHPVSAMSARARARASAAAAASSTEEQSTTDRVEQLRKSGCLVAQITASKKHHTCDIKAAVEEILAPYSEEEQVKVGSHFFSELNRFWKHDREKITKNFDFVIEIIFRFACAETVRGVQTIVVEYNKCTRIPSSEGATLLQILLTAIMSPPTPPAKSVPYVERLLATNPKMVPAVSAAIEALPQEAQAGILDEGLETHPEDLAVFLGCMAFVSGLAAPIPAHLHAQRDRALEKALSLLETRSEHVLQYSLDLLARLYIEEALPEETAHMILSGAIRTLLLRTKLDAPGITALSIVNHAIFVQNISLPDHEKTELVATIKYDLFYYQTLLLHFLDDLPPSDLIQIISKINTPEAKSARLSIKKAVVQYAPPPQEGIKIFSALVAQAMAGSVSERAFVLEIITETLPKYVQGAWTTGFLKLSEALANERTPEIEERLRALISTTITASAHKPQIKKIYAEWKTKPPLLSLVRKLSSVFTH